MNKLLSLCLLVMIISGCKGDIGEQGPRGEQGPIGLTGLPGEQGPTGPAGIILTEIALTSTNTCVDAGERVFLNNTGIRLEVYGNDSSCSMANRLCRIDVGMVCWVGATQFSFEFTGTSMIVKILDF